ncbi:MAG: HIT domain-containing protein [Deltaproteobacteria bacterium]|nr:HIT domain-containing protein [Deltaproteobacteria bacterium]
MKQLWAPWRMTYIEEPEADECIFCVKEIEGEDHQRLILKRGTESFIMMNKFPYSNGHLLIAPYRHTADMNDLSDSERLEIFQQLVLCQYVLKNVFHPEGFNIGMNLGKVAGAGVAEHLHFHVVPRWNGDTNFMPVFSDVRVIPQHLETTFQKLADGFSAV